MKTAEEYSISLIIAYQKSIAAKNESFLKDELVKTYISLLRHELKELIEIRHIKKGTAMIAILKEQRNKFASICKKCNAVMGDGAILVEYFDEAVKQLYPDIFEFYSKQP